MYMHPFPFTFFSPQIITEYFIYRIKYIHLNTITFTQIIISWILRNRLSDSLWRSGMENMLRQIGNLFYIPFCMAFIFTIQYYLLHFNFSLKISIKIVYIMQLKFIKKKTLHTIKYFTQHNKKNNLTGKNNKNNTPSENK